MTTEQSPIHLENNPFSPTKSGYGINVNGVFESVLPTDADLFTFHHEAHNYFRDHVLDPTFACIAGQAAVKTNQYAFCAYDNMADPEVAEGVCFDITRYKKDFNLEEIAKKRGIRFVSFVAAFKNPPLDSQLDGAEYLYTLLQNMHQVDGQHNQWDPSVSDDETSSEFGFSVAETAFFVPLLYPHASSAARRSEYTFVVFNAHTIFKKLRENGGFDQLTAIIRQRQVNNGWTVHPNLGNHGQTNEFIQYALVDPDNETQKKERDIRESILGKCPFKGS